MAAALHLHARTTPRERKLWFRAQHVSVCRGQCRHAPESQAILQAASEMGSCREAVASFVVQKAKAERAIPDEIS